MRETSDANALRAFIEEIMGDFPKRAKGRREACFFADNGERIWVLATPLEEYVITAMIYSVEVAVKIYQPRPPREGPNPLFRLRS